MRRGTKMPFAPKISSGLKEASKRIKESKQMAPGVWTKGKRFK
jgi:hypothetical protein